ncbi:hypothetical protein KUTeg_021961 [Tegillarca granosa]|uniref:Copper type II ascorbate-dependent monooxygenase C-terminal domain-containing protein n=1 Tax=Tegillarca granosa TaxID=220873 RepID=A0ABQ9E584_TEGGR|nr:hypothetical protein KUTeg_021961 [Tegillarca granosa]
MPNLHGKINKTPLHQNYCLQYKPNRSELFDSYINQTDQNLKTPIQMLPGDEIKMSCLYMSKYKTTPTYYGQGVTSEMCYGFIYFYPIEHSPLSRCIDTGSFCFCTY